MKQLQQQPPSETQEGRNTTDGPRDGRDGQDGDANEEERLEDGKSVNNRIQKVKQLVNTHHKCVCRFMKSSPEPRDTQHKTVSLKGFWFLPLKSIILLHYCRFIYFTDEILRFKEIRDRFQIISRIRQRHLQKMLFLYEE